MKEAFIQRLTSLRSLLKAVAGKPAHLQPQVIKLERDIIFPVRMVFLAVLYYSLHFTPWIGLVSYSLDVGVESVVSLYWIYLGANLVGGVVLVLATRVPASVTRGTVMFLSLLDAMFLAGLTLITGGYDSILYWVFVVLVVRNLFSAPLSPVQLLLNACTAGCYLLAGIGDFVLATTMDETTRLTLGLDQPPAGNAGEVLLVRTALLLLVALCGFGVQLLLERQHRAEADAREHQLREGQLKSTGRLAAEIAHQLKNPLAIINNTTYSLQKITPPDQQQALGLTRMIREEIERADRILTQVMGYARLSEGSVERLEVAQVLDAAVQEVFPAGTDFAVTLQRAYATGLPPVMMQRAHLREALVNLLTNARDAAGEAGVIRLQTRAAEEDGVEIAVTDSGPGIPTAQQQRIFEAYFTTKPKGSGLGLAITRNNVELYGGHLRVDSELGKGATFTVFLPIRLPNSAQT